MANTTQPLPNQWNEMWLVALGAVPGALVRWQVQNDLLVNVIGAAILGLAVGLPFRPSRLLLLGVGFCGSLTTFSSWMVDSLVLITKGDWISALGLIGLTLVLGVVAAGLGFLIGRQISP